MLDEKSIRADLEKTAKDILSQKFWPYRDVAIFLGYAINYVDMVVDRARCHVLRLGGIRKLYAIDVLHLFEEQCGVDFPDLARAWCEQYHFTPPKKYTQQTMF